MSLTIPEDSTLTDRRTWQRNTRPPLETYTMMLFTDDNGALFDFGQEYYS